MLMYGKTNTILSCKLKKRKEKKKHKRIFGHQSLLSYFTCFSTVLQLQLSLQEPCVCACMLSHFSHVQLFVTP